MSSKDSMRSWRLDGMGYGYEVMVEKERGACKSKVVHARRIEIKTIMEATGSSE